MDSRSLVGTPNDSDRSSLSGRPTQLLGSGQDFAADATALSDSNSEKVGAVLDRRFKL